MKSVFFLYFCRVDTDDTATICVTEVILKEIIIF